MADLVLKDGVKETTSTTGTGTLTLSGAVVGNRSFADIGNGKLTCYTAFDPLASPPTKESGIGTYTASGTTLSRDTVLSNSLGTTAKINFTHAPIVWCDTPSAIFQGPAFLITATGIQNVSSGVITKASLTNVVLDSNGCVASSRFTPTTPGIYLISGSYIGDDTVTATSVIGYIYKNGAAIKTMLGPQGGGGYIFEASIETYMNGSSDYVELFGQSSGTAPYFRYLNSTWCCALGGSYQRAM